MKKLLYLLFVLCLTIFLVGCGGRIANTEEEMLEIVIEELDLEISVQKIGAIDLGEVVLACYMIGNEYQAHTYGYAEFKKLKNGYKFLRTYPMMKRGMDLRSALYKDSYLFVINNENCINLRISFENGEEKLIAVDKIPFVYYLEDALNHNFEYQFLDKNSEEI